MLDGFNKRKFWVGGEETGSAEGSSKVDVIGQGPTGSSQWHPLSDLLIQPTPEIVY